MGGKWKILCRRRCSKTRRWYFRLTSGWKPRTADGVPLKAVSHPDRAMAARMAWWLASKMSRCAGSKRNSPARIRSMMRCRAGDGRIAAQIEIGSAERTDAPNQDFDPVEMPRLFFALIGEGYPHHRILTLPAAPLSLPRIDVCGQQAGDRRRLIPTRVLLQYTHLVKKGQVIGGVSASTKRWSLSAGDGVKCLCRQLECKARVPFMSGCRIAAASSLKIAGPPLPVRPFSSSASINR